MTSAARRTVLVAGLGKYAKVSYSTDEIIRRVEVDVKQASEMGFDCTTTYINPEDPPTALETVKQALQEQKWDAFSIGYGIRGDLDHTGLFEQLVNASREISPQTKLLFSTAPDGIVEAIKRAYPEVN